MLLVRFEQIKKFQKQILYSLEKIFSLLSTVRKAGYSV
jgi:hypothetical protein